LIYWLGLVCNDHRVTAKQEQCPCQAAGSNAQITESSSKKHSSRLQRWVQGGVEFWKFRTIPPQSVTRFALFRQVALAPPWRSTESRVIEHGRSFGHVDSRLLAR
jgi:hypothetical protein